MKVDYAIIVAMNPSEELIEGRRKKRRRLLIVVIALVVLFVTVPLLWFGVSVIDYYGQIKRGEIGSPADRSQLASISRIAANTDVTPEDLERLKPVGLVPELGSRNANITIIEFIDYECPFCKENASAVRSVMDELGDKVHFLIRDFPIAEINPNARDAALASNCVLEQGQKAYWRYHDLLFANQDDLSGEELRRLAALANINVARFDECMQTRKYDLKIDKDIEVGRQAGVEGTPTFFVNGVRYQGVLDEQLLTRIINYFLENLPQ